MQHVQVHGLDQEQGEDGEEEGEEEEEEEEWQEGDPIIEYALNKALKVITIYPMGLETVCVITFLEGVKSLVQRELQNAHVGNLGIRWYMCCNAKIEKIGKEGEHINSEAYFPSTACTTLPGHDANMLYGQLNEAIQEMYGNSGELNREEGSNWQITEISYLKIFIGKYRPVRGSQYMELPKLIRNNHFLLNIQNNDTKCFLWSILASLHPVPHGGHGNRVTKYTPYQHELNMEGIEYPVAVKDIPKFEKQNPNICVNVFGYDTTFYPLYISKLQEGRHLANLLLIDDEEEGKSHYCLIRDLNKMLSSASYKNKHRKYFCTYCLHGFTREDLLMKHQPACQSHGLQAVHLPSEKERWMKFKNFGKSLKAPFVIYADFECILEPVQEGGGKKNKHTPCGYSYLVVSAVDEYEKQPEVVTYSGENVMQHFFEDMIGETEHLLKRLKKKIPMNWRPEDQQKFEETEDCHICGKFMRLGDRVRDHCHLTGKFRGAAHNR